MTDGMRRYLVLFTLFLNIVFLGFVATAVATFNHDQQTRFEGVLAAQGAVLCQQLDALAHIANRLGIPVDFSVPAGCDSDAVVALTAAPLCTFTGTTNGDVEFGDAENEVICTDGGADYVEADGGRDLLLLGDSVDFGDGGAGPDALLGGEGDDLLIGSAGHDVLVGGAGADVLDASDGKQNDKLDGGEGVDVCTGDVGDHFSECETVLAKPLPLVVVAAVRSSHCTITGDSGNNTLVGTPGSDTICARGGNDQLQGGASHDVLRAGAGNDYAEGDDGGDTLRGNQGNDTLVGGGSHDVLRGRPGNDKLFAIDQAGGDLVDGGLGDDYCFGDTGDTFLNCEHITKP